jgi:hypothetical protein
MTVGVKIMDARKLVLPAAVFVGGAILGRMIGFKGLVRAGMAALTVANMSESAGLLTAGKRAAHKAVQKPARKRSVQRKSAPKKRTHAASAQTH